MLEFSEWEKQISIGVTSRGYDNGHTVVICDGQATIEHKTACRNLLDAVNQAKRAVYKKLLSDQSIESKGE